MAIAKKIDADYFALEVGATWIVLNQMFGNTAAGYAKLDKVRWLKGEIVFDEIQKKLKIPPGDPVTVGKAISAYLSKVGSSDVQLHKISDNEFLYAMKHPVMQPIHPLRGDNRPDFDKNQLLPLPAAALFRAALKRLCNMEVEVISVTDETRATKLKGKPGSLWRLSPIK
ncbi:MAG: hypothetical protein HY529_01280 [Chloroflexi bacterium]|nr:hypothetical protein [Chloroflexota bacterium]